MLLLESTSTSTSSAASSPPTSTIASSSSSSPSSSAASSTVTSSLSTLSHFGLTMLTTGANQYIQPDYLSPLPTTLDAKRSPLALLAQTCSQIGADPIPASSSTSTSSSSMLTSTVSMSSMSSNKATGADKPSGAKKADSEKSSSNRKTPPSSLGKDEKSGFKSPGSKPATSSPSGVTATATSAFTPSADTKLSEAQRAALDALAAQQQQLAKDISPLGASLGAYRPMFSSLPSLPGIHPAYHAGLAGLDPATAAALGAFRHPAAYPSHLSAYPPTSLGLSLAYQQALTSYGRLAHPAAMGKSADGVCRDPYCTGCPSSLMTPTSAAAAAVSASSPVTSSASGASCPAGCNQCDHQKTSIASSMITSTASSSAATTTSMSSSVSPNLASSRPYVCNWIAADQYCGKRFTSSEELLQHLRTHTSLSIPPANPVAPSVEPLTSPSYSPLLNPSLAHSHLLASSAAAAALHRTYPTPPLSPLSMARYHPYSKPASASPLSAAPAAPIGVPPATSGAAPPPPNPLLSLHNPYAGLGAYYSHPYSLYSQRMLAGAGVLP